MSFFLSPYRFTYLAAACDPYWSYVPLLLHMDGTNGSTAAPTNSSASGILIARDGGNLSSTQARFGTTSYWFDGSGTNSAGTRIISTPDLKMVFGAGDFTIEFSMFVVSAPSASAILVDGRAALTQGAYPTLYLSPSMTLGYYVSSADRITSASALSLSTWYHVAIVRSAGVTKLYVNGTQYGSSWTDSTNYIADGLVFGASSYHTAPNTQYGLYGYMDEVRVTKGIARYTAAFTPPTAAFADSACAWTPATEPGVDVWIDFSDSSEMSLVSSDIDSVWSKAANDTLQAVAIASTRRPTLTASALNGLSVASFSGDAMYIANNGGGWLNGTDIFRNVSGGYVAALYRSNPSNPNSNSRILFFNSTPTDTTTRLGLFQSIASSGANSPALLGRRLDADSGQTLNSGSSLGTAWTIVVGYIDWANSDAYVYVNGTLAASTTSFQTSGSTSNTASNTSPTIGAALNGGASVQHFEGDIAQVFVGRSALTTTVRQKLEGYLAHTYGLTANLPSDHPYKTTPPV